MEGGSLRTGYDPKGLGLLVFRKEKFANCQLRVVCKTKGAKSNAGVFVRIADGILEQVDRPGAAFDLAARPVLAAGQTKVKLALLMVLALGKDEQVVGPG